MSDDEDEGWGGVETFRKRLQKGKKEVIERDGVWCSAQKLERGYRKKEKKGINFLNRREGIPLEGTPEKSCVFGHCLLNLEPRPARVGHLYAIFLSLVKLT